MHISVVHYLLPSDVKKRYIFFITTMLFYLY